MAFAEPSSLPATMENQLRSRCEKAFSASPNLEDLAAARALIINPATSVSSLSSLLEALGRFIHLRADPHLIQRALMILHDLAFNHTHFSPLVFDLVRRCPLLDSTSTRLAAQSLSLVSTVADSDRSLAPVMEEIGERLFLSLSFRPSVSVRYWLLFNAGKFSVRPSVLLTVLLGFTTDPYPYVRRVALDGLVRLSNAVVFEDRALIEGCYCRAVELQRDTEDCIRLSAIRAVFELGLKLMALHEEKSRRDWSTLVFIQLCCMVRDMSMMVRVEAFNALGKMEMIPDCVLLQTLSKRVLGTAKEEKHLVPCFMKELEKQARSIAGAFAHGLEDEFYEVRSCACRSLRTLTNLSSKFAGEALNMLMDVLNDDSMVVRLHSLEAINQIATHGYMKVQEIHMDMFLGTLLDNSTLIRIETRKILRSVKLPNINVFKSCVDGLLQNLEIYSKDEADIFSLLFKIGRAHGNFIPPIIKVFFPEMESSCKEKLDFDNARVAALLMLAISAPLSYEKPSPSVPPRIFSYAAAFFGRFACALSDVMSKSTFLAYLSYCSRFTVTAESHSSEEDSFPLAEGDISNYISGHLASAPKESLSELCDEATKFLNVMFGKIEGLWPLVQSGYISEVKRTLRSCKEELAMFTTDSLGCIGPAAFTLQYIHVVKLLAEMWECFLPPRKLFSCGLGDPNLILGKLNRRLGEMRYTFIGLRNKDAMHVLELILVTGMLRLFTARVTHSFTMLKKLSDTIHHIKLVCEKEAIEPSKFVVELEKLLNFFDTSTTDEKSGSPILLKNVVDMFSLRQLVLCRDLKHIKAELNFLGSDSVKPLPFISGLPVGIPFEITLYNILCENRLWLQMTVGEELKQFVFLDLNEFVDCDGVRKLTFTAPFYRTPKAFSFKLCACIVMECGVEMAQFINGHGGGPKHELVHLCKEKEVYLSMVKKY